jgi:hypothetical protein
MQRDRLIPSWLDKLTFAAQLICLYVVFKSFFFCLRVQKLPTEQGDTSLFGDNPM